MLYKKVWYYILIFINVVKCITNLISHCNLLPLNVGHAIFLNEVYSVEFQC